MDVLGRPVGGWAMNAYALVCTDTCQSVLIDPGAEPDALEDLLADTRCQAILITHCHPDHIGALETMRRQLNVPVKAHPGTGQAGHTVGADQWLSDGDLLPVGRHMLQVYHTPGHTPDQICFGVQDDNIVIVGDTLFEGGPGKTWSAGGFRQTLRTLKETVLQWPDETICCPGHGPRFKLENFRERILRFVQTDHGDFFGDATW